MPKRGENIHKRKDGRWEGRYKKGRNEDGSIKYGSIYGKTYREVKEKLYLAKQKTQEVPITSSSKYTLEQIINLWMKTNSVKFKGATISKYNFLINKHIVPNIGSVEVSHLTTLMLNSFIEQKLHTGRSDGKGGLSPNYVRTIILIITSALQFASNESMCIPPRISVYIPASTKKKISILSINDQKKLEQLLLAKIDPIKAGILISLHTGLRIGEVCALTWDDLDFSEMVIHVRSTVARVRSDNENSNTMLIIDTPKTKASLRDIPMSSMLFSILKDIKEKSNSKYVISEKESFLSPRTYEYRYHKLLDDCGIGSINYHALRHTFATRCIEVGVDIKSLSEILGHSNVSITLNTYVHPSMNEKRSQLEKLSLALKSDV